MYNMVRSDVLILEFKQSDLLCSIFLSEAGLITLKYYGAGGFTDFIIHNISHM